MATEAQFTLDAMDFPLGTIFENLPDVEVELERVVPTENVLVPYFWIRGEPIADIEFALVEHPAIREIALVDSIDDEYLLRAEWKPDHEGVLTGLRNTGVTLLSARGSSERWEFEVRGEDQNAISAFQEYCNDHEIPIRVTNIHRLTPTHGGSEYDLTDTQREALTLAYERGYFDSPRRAELDVIADELDITRQALASRLRRGHKRLLAQTIANS